MSVPDDRMSFRVSSSQLDSLLDFIQKHPILNEGALVGKSKLVYKKLWAKIAAKLNTDEFGSHKDDVQWKRYWINMKNKVKTKTIEFSRKRKGGMKKAIYLNEYDKRVLSIIAKHGKLQTPSGDKLRIPDIQDFGASESDNFAVDGKRDIDGISDSGGIADKDDNNDIDVNDAMTNISIDVPEDVKMESPKVNMDSECDRSRARISVQQQELLVRFMERFPFLAQSLSRGRREKQVAHRSWVKIAAALNKADPRNHKNGHGWHRYWTTLKCSLRTKYFAAREADAEDALSGFTPMQLKVLKIIVHPDELVTGNKAKYLEFEVQPTERVDVTGDSSSFKEELLEDFDDDERNYLRRDYDELTVDPIEDPIDTTMLREETQQKTKEDVQCEFIRFQLARQKERHKQEMSHQKEMHDLQIKQHNERHRLEMEILELKKKRLILEYNRTRKLHITLEQNSKNEA